MPRTDYTYIVPEGSGAGDIFLTDGNLDSGDPTIPTHRIQLSTASNGHTIFQRTTPPNSLLNGRLRLFYKITQRTGTGAACDIGVVVRSQLPAVNTKYWGVVSSTSASGILARLYRTVNGTHTSLGSVQLLSGATAKGTIMLEINGSMLILYATAVLLTDPDSNAYVSTPPVRLTVSDTAISSAGGFGFMIANFASNSSVEIDRFHVFQIE
jgi:hypothetical protein